MVIHGKVIAKKNDILGYSNIIVENLDDAPFGHKYILTTVCPRWQSRIPKVGEVGYLEYSENRAGEDVWYDRYKNTFVPYNYNMFQFLKFIVEEKKDNSKDIII